MKNYYLFILLIITTISCTVNKTTHNDELKFNSDIAKQWNLYLKNTEKTINSTNDKKILFKIKSGMIALYIEGIDDYSDFPDDIAIKISRISEKIDKKIHSKIIRKNNHFKSIDIVANKIETESNNFIGAPDDGTNTVFTEKDLKSSFYWPLKDIYITSPYGFRGDPFEKDKIKFHHGIDIAGKTGDYVISSNYGRVIFTGINGGYGLMVIISHAGNISTVYGHLSKILVKKGQFVKRGEVIAEVGSTGRSTGPHLHFEVRKHNRSIDPIFFIESQGIK